MTFSRNEFLPSDEFKEFNGSKVYEYLWQNKIIPNLWQLRRLYRLYQEGDYRKQDGSNAPLLTVDQFLSLYAYAKTHLTQDMIKCARFPQSSLTQGNKLVMHMTIDAIDAIRILSADSRYQVPLIKIGEELNQPDGTVAPAQVPTKQRLFHFANWTSEQAKAALRDVENGELPNQSFLSTSCIPGGATQFKVPAAPGDTAVTLVIDTDLDPSGMAQIGPISPFVESEGEILLAPNVALRTFKSAEGKYSAPIVNEDNRVIIHVTAQSIKQPLTDVHTDQSTPDSVRPTSIAIDMDTALATFHELGKPANRSPGEKGITEMTIKDGVDELSRIVMRHPNSSVQEQLCVLHQVLKTSFNQCHVHIVDNIGNITKDLIRKDPKKYNGSYIYDKQNKKLYRVLAVDYPKVVDEIQSTQDLETSLSHVCGGILLKEGDIVTLNYEQINQLEATAEIQGGFHMDDEAIGWLLGGSSETSRGGFGSTVQNKARAIALFRQFLDADPTQCSTQYLLTKLETLATAIGYRHIHADFVEPPAKPENPSQHAMAQFIDKFIMDHKLSAAVWDTYPGREADALSDTALTVARLLDPESVIETDDKTDYSDASDSEEGVRTPQRRTGNRGYLKRAGGKPSWPGQATKQGIPVRAHVSGTAPLVLAVLDGLYRLSSDEAKTWFDNDNHVKQLSAALLIAIYSRSDYHTIAETGAGIDHFLHARHIIDRVLMRDSSAPSSSWLEPMTPRAVI